MKTIGSKMEKRLNKKLIDLKKEEIYPLHMPGHKRNMGSLCDKDSFGDCLSRMYELDITEIDGFDNLHDAKEAIYEAEKRAAELYKSEETHFLVNGSTCGILAAVSALGEKGSKIIVARNCHISVYNAIELNEYEPIYIYPEIIANDSINSGISGSIRKEEIEKAVISNPDACGIVITSPTYDGVLSDIASISRIAHEYSIPLIVDEAHGALFYIEGRSAVMNGADVVINSVHKTLPALTQTALIHINGELIDKAKVRKYLRIYQTSSPSYILMGSIDYAIEIMEKEGNRLYRDFCVRTMRLKESLSKLRELEYIDKDSLVSEGTFDFDESKVLISAKNTGLSGKDIYDSLRTKHRLQPEMAAGEYVLLMTTLFDTDDGIERLIKALYEIDRDIEGGNIRAQREPGAKEPPEENREKLKELFQNIGNKSKETIFAYPPGIPIIVSGEIVTEKKYCEIEEADKNRLDLKWI